MLFLSFCRNKAEKTQEANIEIKNKVALITGILDPYDALKIFDKLRPNKVNIIKEDTHDYLVLTRRNGSVETLKSATQKFIENSSLTFFNKLAVYNSRMYRVLFNLISAIAYKEKINFLKLLKK